MVQRVKSLAEIEHSSFAGNADVELVQLPAESPVTESNNSTFTAAPPSAPACESSAISTDAVTVLLPFAT